jgi:hypothetical protein
MPQSNKSLEQYTNSLGQTQQQSLGLEGAQTAQAPAKKSSTGEMPDEPKSKIRKQLEKLRKKGPSPRAVLQDKEPEEEFEQGADDKVSEDEDLWKE